TQIDPFAVVVAIAASVALKRFKISVPLIVLGSALLGVIYRLAVPA
nr:hypothetical protein [Actinomycetota bacterium]